MAGATSNADKIRKAMQRIAATFDFTRPGASGSSFGRDLLANTAVDIRQETVGDQQSPDGTPLAPNRGKYGEKKDEVGLPVGVGLRGKKKLAKGGKANDAERMLSDKQMQGEQSITPDRASIRYGKDDAARRKAGWFTNGDQPGEAGTEPSGADGQPPRPFWGISDAARERRREDCREQVRRAIKEASGS